MQQPSAMMPVTPSFPPTNITTEQIQKYLEENKKLILAILENQNLGKLTECAQYQAQLQKNLMYLAAIADAQPQMPAMSPQMGAPHPAVQQGAYYMHPQAAAMAQPPPGMFSPRMPVQFASPHQLHEQQQQHLHLQNQQAMQGQMNIRPGGTGNGMHPMHSAPALGGGGSGGAAGQNKQDGPETGPGTGAPGGAAGGHGGGGGGGGGGDGDASS